jgi:hypothetical protein
VGLLLLLFPAAAAVLLGDYSVLLPNKAKVLLTPGAPIARGGGRTKVGLQDRDAIDETHTFAVEVPGLEAYDGVTTSQELLALLDQRLSSESVSVGKGGAYKLWLSKDVVLVSLRVFPFGYKTFLLRAEEPNTQAQAGEGVLEYSVLDISRGGGSTRCTLTTHIELSGLSPKVSINCVSLKLNKALKKRLLKALQEAWSTRLAADVSLCLSRLMQSREHKRLASEAFKEKKRVENDKVLNPPKQISPTVRRPGGGGRLNLGADRRASKTQTRVVRRGG